MEINNEEFFKLEDVRDSVIFFTCPTEGNFTFVLQNSLGEEEYSTTMDVEPGVVYFIGHHGILFEEEMKISIYSEGAFVENAIINGEHLFKQDNHAYNKIGADKYNNIKQYLNSSYSEFFDDSIGDGNYSINTLGEEFFRSCKNIIDIGSNGGFLGLYLSQFANIDKYICVEPNTRLNDVNLLINEKFLDSIKIYENLFYSESGKQFDFYLSDDARGWGESTSSANIRIDTVWDFKTDDKKKTSIDLKTIISENNIDEVDILKIDTEGAEIYLVDDEYNVEFIKDKVKVLLVEAHSIEIEEKFLKAFGKDQFDIIHTHMNDFISTIQMVNKKFKSSDSEIVEHGGLSDKVMLLVPHLSTGGMPQYVLWLIEKLVKENDVYVIEFCNLAPSYNIQKNRIRDIIGDKLITLLGDDIERCASLFQLIDKIEPGVIYLQEVPELFLPDIITDKLYSDNKNYKIIETSHNSNYHVNDKKLFPDSFVAISEYMKEKYSSIDVPCSVLEMKIDKKIRPSRKEVLEGLGLDPSYTHILNVGLFTYGKNQGEIFEMAKKMSNEKIQFHFIGNMAINFKDYWEPLINNKPENCKVWGERGDVDSFYSCMDLFLFTSLNEANPIVIKEAISWNIPILMYDLEPCRGLYDEKEDISLLSNSRDENIDKLLNIIGKKELRHDLKLVHLLTRPEDDREVKSVRNISRLSRFGFPYVKRVNSPATEYPFGSKTFFHHDVKRPGYWGNYNAFKDAITEEFDSEFLMICECDCEIEIPYREFVDLVNNVCDVMKREEIYYFSFGDIEHSTKIKDVENADFMQYVDKIICCHCILFHKSAIEFLRKSFQREEWDVIDLFFSRIFEEVPFKKATLAKDRVCRQAEGYSLIDNINVCRGGHRDSFIDDVNEDMINVAVSETTDNRLRFDFNFNKTGDYEGDDLSIAIFNKHTGIKDTECILNCLVDLNLYIETNCSVDELTDPAFVVFFGSIPICIKTINLERK
jgi:FkbM family methyltransferase